MSSTPYKQLLEQDGFRRPYPSVTWAQVRNAKCSPRMNLLDELLLRLAVWLDNTLNEKDVSLDDKSRYRLVAEYVNGGRFEGLRNGTGEITESIIADDFRSYVTQRVLRGVCPPGQRDLGLGVGQGACLNQNSRLRVFGFQRINGANVGPKVIQGRFSEKDFWRWGEVDELVRKAAEAEEG